MAWKTSAEREKNLWEAKAKLDEVLTPFNRAAPRSFTDESHDLYRRRTLPIVQQYAPNYQNVKVDDARGSAFDLLERQIYDDARQEAKRQIPEGQLKEIVSYDQAGRPSYSYFGSPKTWMNDFAAPKKNVVSIMDGRNFQKV
jgi:hypothetical protein